MPACRGTFLIPVFCCWCGFVFSQTVITFQEKSSPDQTKTIPVGGPSMSELYQIKVNSIDGKETSLDFLKGKVALVVNVASRCGFTPQYQGLEELYRKYQEKGLVILGFPCNQFGGQEPGSDSEISSFCTLKYEVSFPMFAKVDVNGKNAHPLFVYLKAQAPGVLGSEGIKWNFSKFLISRDGRKIKRFASIVKPAELEADILALINEPYTP